MPADVSVILVSWNTGAYIGSAIDAVPAASHPLTVETIVVDNGSSDGSQELLSTLPVELVELGQNTGFTRAANVGAARASGRFLLFLNPDVVTPPGSIATLVRRLETETEAYGATPWFRNPDGSPQYFWRRAPSPLIIAFCFTRPGRRIDRALGRPVHRHRSYAFLPDPPGVRHIHGVGAACLLLRREEFDEVGGFDERYFNFFQDAHLEREFARRGRRFIGDGTVEVSHEGAVSMKRLEAWEVEGQFFHALRQYLAGEPWWRRALGEALIRLELRIPGGHQDVRRALRKRALRPVDLPE